MQHLNRILFSVGLSIFLSGCGSPHDANEANFKKAINAHLTENCISISPRSNNYPVTIELLPADDKLASSHNPAKTLQYDALAEIGLLEVEDGSALVDKGWFNREKITVPTRTYSLSPKGEQLQAKNTGANAFSGPIMGFCVATHQVNEISAFSEPSPSMGYTASRVNFTVSPTNVQEWATDENIVRAFPRLAKELETDIHRSAALVLMNDGWLHEKDIRR